MRKSSFLTTLCFVGLMLFGLQFVSPPSAAFSLTATVDIKPDTLNVNMRGRWITAYIGLPEGYNISDIDPLTILLESLFKAEQSNIEGDVLMVKFDASGVTDYLWGKLYHMGVNRAQVDLMIEGKLKDGPSFAGSDTMSIMNPPFGY